VNRGGSWNNNARNCRSANRNRNTPENRNNNLGFRVLRSSANGMDVPLMEPAAVRLSDSRIVQRNSTRSHPVLVASGECRLSNARGGFCVE